MTTEARGFQSVSSVVVGSLHSPYGCQNDPHRVHVLAATHPPPRPSAAVSAKPYRVNAVNQGRLLPARLPDGVQRGAAVTPTESSPVIDGHAILEGAVELLRRITTPAAKRRDALRGRGKARLGKEKAILKQRVDGGPTWGTRTKQGGLALDSSGQRGCV